MRGITKSIVVGDEAFEIVTQLERRGEMEGIKTPKSIRIQLRRPLEGRRGHAHNRDRIDDGTGTFHLIGRAASSRTEQLGAQQITCHNLVVVGDRPPGKRGRAAFGDHEFHGRRGIEIERHLPALVGAEPIEHVREFGGAARSARRSTEIGQSSPGGPGPSGFDQLVKAIRTNRDEPSDWPATIGDRHDFPGDDPRHHR